MSVKDFNPIMSADIICKTHDEMRELAGASTIYYDLDGVSYDSHGEGRISLSARESYTILDVLSMITETSQP